MTKITRRGFIGLLTSAIAAPALPAWSEQSGAFVLEGQTLVLNETLDLRGLPNIVIRDCVFKRGPDLPDDASLILIGSLPGQDACGCVKLGRNWFYDIA